MSYKNATMKLKLSIILTLFITIFGTATAQTYPVVSTSQVLPPYSVYLSDYASISSDKLIANLFLQDQNQSGLQVKLKITITGDNGVKLETKPEYMPPPITMYAGMPEQISGTDLQQYLEPVNLNITGLNVNQFMQSKKLPEGIYIFSVQAIEYRRNKPVSNPGTAVAWLILNDPPIWNLPHNNSTVTATNPQNIFFSWFPMHTGSPNSAFTIEYEFSLYDLIPQNTNPDNFVNTANPIYQTTTTGNSLVYGPAEMPLELGRKYAVRLKAYDTEGRDMFKNNGYSTVLVFTYGQECITPVGINHSDITPHTANISWTQIPGNTEFTLYYREKDEGGTLPWYEATTAQTSATITQLKPQHNYQYVVKALCGTIESEPSAIYEFTTTEKTLDTLNCGDNPNVPVIDGSPPLQELLFGDVINVGGFEGIITQAHGGNGVFSGKCIMRVSNFNILLKSHFDDISINQSYQVTAGRVIADRGPGIMINLDDIIEELDSLANIEIDTTIINNPDDYLEDLEIVYDITPDIITDSIAEDLEEIAEDLEEFLGSGDLTQEQQDAIEDLLNQIDILSDDEDKSVIKQGDETIYILTKLKKSRIFKHNETIYLNREIGKTQKIKLKKSWVKSGSSIYKFLGTLTADWYLDSTKIANNNKKCNVLLDSTGIYNLKACINYTSGDTISIIDTIEVNVNIIDNPVVFFDKHKGYLGEFGFEKYEHPEFKDDLSLEKIKVNNLDYYVPWLSLSVGQTAYLDARIFVPSLYSGLKVKFESSNPSRIMIMGVVTEYDSTSLKQGYNKISIPILANDTTGFNIFCPVYVKNENDSIIGKINVVSEKEDNYTGFNLTLVKVITDTLNRPINLVKITKKLQKELEDFSYKQAFVKWTDIKYDTLNLTGYIDTTYLSELEIDYNKSLALRDTLINWYKIKKGGRLKKRFVVFIVDKEGAISSSGGKLNGIAKWPKTGEDNYLVIYYNAKENYDTYIHELGHNFGLQHPFGQFPNIQKYSTKNIMDYESGRNYFWQWQCKQIRNFKFID